MIVGRLTELSRLDRLVDGLLAGDGGRLLIVGEPGIGKTMLVDAGARRAGGRGVRVVRVGVAHGTDELPFAMLDDVERALGPGEPDAGRVAAVRGDALLRRLRGDTSHGPVLLGVDDVHEADPDSLAALAQALVRGTGLPLLALLTSGPCPPPQLADWPRLDLQPLDQEAATVVLRTSLGPGLPVDVLARMAASLGGNPLALVDAPHLLTDAQRAGASPAPSALPFSPALARAWQPTLDRLPPRTRSALVQLAVAGSRPDLLAAVTSASGASLDDLDDAVRAGLVVLDAQGRPAYRHRVISDAVLANAAGADVRAAHRWAAQAAEELGLTPGVIVGHLARSVGTADADVARRIEAQAERAEGLDLLMMASDAWQAAARLSTTQANRVARALRGIRLVILNGLDYAGPETLLEMLEGEELDEESACWVEWLRALERYETDPGSALSAQWSTIRRARVVTPESVRTLLYDAANNAWSLGDAAGGLAAAREYAELEHALGSAAAGVEPPWTGTALVAAALFQSGAVAEAVALRREAIHAAEGVDPWSVPFDRLLATVFLDDILLDTGPAAADRVLVAEQRMADESAPRAALYGIQAWRARARGEWATALRLLAIGQPLAWATGATGVQLGMAALSAELAALTGDDARLKEDGERLRALAVRVGDARRLATLDRAIGLAALVDGRLEAAITSLAAAADVAFLGRGLRDGVLPARVDLVEACVRSGDMAAARRRRDALHPLLEAMSDADASALDARTGALIAEPGQAGALFEDALRAHEAGLDPFERGRTLLLFGEHLRRTRQRTAARAALGSAGRCFDILGATPWLARARAELRAAGGQSEPMPEAGGLTPQELAVARAVAEGRTNREVAEALYLSPRTVEYHLGSVYRKLGVHGRGALARQLASGADSSASG